METKRHRRRTRSKRGRSEPVVQKSEGPGRRSLAASTTSRQTSAIEPRTTGAVAELAGTGSPSLRVSRAGLDHSARGGDDPAAGRRQLSSCSWQPPPSPSEVQSTKTHPKGDPAR